MKIALAILLVISLACGSIVFVQMDKINALRDQLETAQLTLAEKANERQREQDATVFRDEEFQKYDKRLADIQKSLRKLHVTSEEMRTVLRTVVPGDALRGVRGYEGYIDESESTRASSAATKVLPGVN